LFQGLSLNMRPIGSPVYDALRKPRRSSLLEEGSELRRWLHPSAKKRGGGRLLSVIKAWSSVRGADAVSWGRGARPRKNQQGKTQSELPQSGIRPIVPTA
jgi:hypothetical protein